MFWSKLTRLLACIAVTSTTIAAESGVAVQQIPGWPEIWGDVNARAYWPGDRVAPNGVVFDPVFGVDFHLNIGLQPQKKLYTFLDSDFWAQRAAKGITNNKYGSYDFSKRESDIALGIAGEVFDRFELRGSVYGQDNLNRGSSQTLAQSYQRGVRLESRYYFGDANIYDTGRLNFVGLGYAPDTKRISATGFEFRTGLFAEAYLTYPLPALRSYLFADATLIAANAIDPRLVQINAGLALRPFDSLPALELRVGDEFSTDLKEDAQRNLAYLAIRAYFGGSTGSTSKPEFKIYDAVRSPEIWGGLGFSVDGGRRLAANGIEFTPLFMSDLSLNLSLYSRPQVYLFVSSQVWVQSASEAGDLQMRDPARDEINEREWDVDAGLAIALSTRFEFRGAVYAQNNLNRGGSTLTHQPPSALFPAGYHDGEHAQLRYYLTTDHPHDEARQSFVELGYYPSRVAIPGSASGTHAGGAFARAHLTYPVSRLHSYVYADGTFVAEQASLRVFSVNSGVAARPFPQCENLEFRVGNEVTRDVSEDDTRDLVYGAIRINFSTR